MLHRSPPAVLLGGKDGHSSWTWEALVKGLHLISFDVFADFHCIAFHVGNAVVIHYSRWPTL